MKLGSLFDGIGGFPYAARQLGIKPVWASEIEPFPIRVTQHHFPNMKHLGDITQINGADIEPVDIITFGSPCQDLSVAGKREGLAGARSGLFMDAVRIIRGMRSASSGIYPRFAVWENVPGAFSSNKGEDFRAVLEEIAEAEIPMPPSGKWANAGMVRTRNCDLAWRILDAQYWGVPQRRRRIFLVADFGGQCAGEILFKPEGLRRDLAESGEAREEIAGDVGTGVNKSNGIIPFNTGQITSPQNGNNPKPCDPCHTLCANEHIPAIAIPQRDAIGIDAYNFSVSGDIAVSLTANSGSSPTHSGPAIMQRINSTPAGISGAVSSKWAKGTGGPAGDECYNLVAVGYQESPDISHCLRSEPSKADKPDSTTYVIQNATRGKSQNGLGISQDDVSYTLDSLGNHAVCIQGSMIGRADKNGPQGDGINEDVCFTLNTTDRHAVVTIEAAGLTELIPVLNIAQASNDASWNVSPTLCARMGTGGNQVPVFPSRYRVRRLTPLECERLQGFPDNWTNIPGASDTARYKAIGNSVAIPCVLFVLSGITEVLRSDVNASKISRTA